MPSEGRSRRITVAAAQFSATEDVTENLATAVAVIGKAAREGVQVLALPEAAMCSFTRPLAPIAETVNGAFADGIRLAAIDAKITVAVGMFEPADDDRVYNTTLIVGPEIDTYYRKVHLYDAPGFTESETVAAGDEYVVVQLSDIALGFATCYDVRFAEQFLELGRRGAELVLVGASWADGPGKLEQWNLLTRARASDAQAYLLAAAQALRMDYPMGPIGVGRSVLVDPLGGVIKRLDGKPGMLIADIDVAEVASVRQMLPVL